MNEFRWIESLKRKVPRKPGTVGIGDDAAVFPAGRGKILCTTDAIVDGVDFYLARLTPEKIGRKALAVNLSDIAAMGGRPESFVVTLGIPADVREAWLNRFYDGMLALARRHGVICVGGDVSRARQFFASVTLWGRAARPVPRSGARPGHWIGVTGNLGGSILRHHHEFEPRLSEGAALARLGAKAMIDVSDGLAQDLGHVLKASRVSAAVELDKIPVSRDALKLAKGNRGKALMRALSDGEDFELVFTVSGAGKRNLEKKWKRLFPRTRLSWIGRIVKRRKKSGIEWRREGKPLPGFRLEKEGYRHF
ncbi:MAG TPA: thiamine-phosphate kinase [Verrucomicrobiae bacterium]|nr:thiamine-phosphate kinase [Verrucomicrobiae bacterium]